MSVSTKQKRTRRPGEQSCGCHSREGRREEQDRVGDQEIKTTMYKVNKEQGHIVQQKKIYPFFVVTLP